MSITVNLYYMGENGNARKFAEEMEQSGVADRIRNEDGNLRYEYFVPLKQPETVLLIDSWSDQSALDRHHASPLMGEIMRLREKYGLTARAERFVPDKMPDGDRAYIKKD